MKRALLCCLPCAWLMLACSTPRVALEPVARSEMAAVSGSLYVPQEEIYADINESNMATAMGGGLLFALADAIVDNASTNKAELRVSAVRDALIEFDFLETLDESWVESDALPEWFAIEDVAFYQQYDDESIRMKLREGKTVMVGLYDYHVQADFSGFRVSATISVYTPSLNPTAKGRLKVAYFNTFSVESELMVPETFTDAAVKEAWVEQAADALIFSQQEMVRMFAYDISIMKGTPTKSDNPYVHPYGRLIKNQGVRTWYRDNMDAMHSVTSLR